MGSSVSLKYHAIHLRYWFYPLIVQSVVIREIGVLSFLHLWRDRWTGPPLQCASF